MSYLFKASFVVLLVAFISYVVVNYMYLKQGTPSQKLTGYLAIQRLKFQMANLVDFFGIATVHETMQKYEATGIWSSTLESTPSVEVNVTKFANVSVIIYKPRNMAPQSPSIVFYHGGLYLYGAPQMTHFTLLNLTQQLNYPIIFIDYRRSLQAFFPAAYEDALTATQYYLQHGASELGADPHRVALMGDDVGCSLVLSVTLALRDERNTTKVKLQIMWNPVLQALQFHTPAIQQYGNSEHFHKFHLTEGLLLYLLGEKSLVASSLLTKVMGNNDHVNGEELSKFLPHVDWTNLIPEYSSGTFSNKPHPNRGNPFLSSRFTEAVKDVRYSPLSAATDEELKTVPPLYLVSCATDAARDDALMYKARLTRVRKFVYHKEYTDACGHHVLLHHTFLQPTSVKALAELMHFFNSNAML